MYNDGLFEEDLLLKLGFLVCLASFRIGSSGEARVLWVEDKESLDPVLVGRRSPQAECLA